MQVPSSPCLSLSLHFSTRLEVEAEPEQDVGAGHEGETLTLTRSIRQLFHPKIVNFVSHPKASLENPKIWGQKRGLDGTCIAYSVSPLIDNAAAF